jgi:hypothetical protein
LPLDGDPELRLDLLGEGRGATGSKGDREMLLKETPVFPLLVLETTYSISLMPDFFLLTTFLIAFRLLVG